MNGPLEADMLRSRTKMRLHNPPVRFKPELEADGIGFPANETRMGVRKCFHIWNRQLVLATRKR
jgi:hypothetical protein